MSKIFIDTMGCPKNQEDSERLWGLFKHRGHELVTEPKEADAIIVNTCGFIDDAKRESIDAILEFIKYKDHNEKIKVIVTGCLAQRYGKELFEEFKEVDVITGVNDYLGLPEIIETLIEEDKNERILKTDGKPGFVDGERSLINSAHTAYLKVAEGCSNNCSYCVIPHIRGAYRSVKMEDVIKEAENLAGAGVKELVLIAQDVSAYGIDIYEEFALPKLLKKLCSIEGIRWIRLLYCYEDRITDELIDVIASEEKICKYIDIPLQHISGDILSAMNRTSKPEYIKATIGKLRKKVPSIAIRTTFITGFPGEMEEDFKLLKDFVEETEFDRLGVFCYSKEEGTKAAEMKGQIPNEVAVGRRDDIMRIQMDISFKKNENMIGNVYDVLIDGVEDGICYGRTRYDAPEIDNAVIINSFEDNISAGDFVKVRITDAYDYDLIGEIENESAE